VQDLRCHPEYRALHGSERCIVVVDIIYSSCESILSYVKLATRLTAPLRDTEVRNLAHARGVEKDVIGLEVPMQDFSRMKVLQTTEHLRCEGPDDLVVELAMLP